MRQPDRSPDIPTPDPAAEQLRQAQQQKAERDRQQQERRERKALIAEVRQIIESNRIDRKGGEAAYQFVESGRIRKIYRHEAQRVQVVKGALAVVRLGRNFERVPPAVADKIAERARAKPPWPGGATGRGLAGGRMVARSARR